MELFRRLQFQTRYGSPLTIISQNINVYSLILMKALFISELPGVLYIRLLTLAILPVIFTSIINGKSYLFIPSPGQF